MTGKDFKIKLIMLDIKQSELANELGVTERTVNKVCNLNIVPLLYQWAIYGIEFKRNKGI